MKAQTLRNLALAAVTVSVALGFARVFDGTSFAVPLVAATIAAHVIAAATRRLRHGVATVVMMCTGALVTIGATSPRTTTFGLPTASTFPAIAENLRGAKDVLTHGSAPTAPIAGLMLITAGALWCSAWSADRLAFTYRAPLEALAPSAGVFGVVTLLAGPHHRWLGAALYAIAAAVHLIVERSTRDLPEDAPVRKAGRTIVTGGAMASVALLAGLGVAAAVPALRSDGAIALRTNLRDGPPRSVVSPLVDIRSRLINASDARMFTVRSTGASYWRLMNLDDFDGTVWSSDQRYRSVSGRLPTENAPQHPGAETRKLVADFNLSGLGGPWAPAAFRPVALSGTDALLWDDVGSTLIVRASVGQVTGLHYRATSTIPIVGKAQAAAATGVVPTSVMKRDLQLPGDFPSDLRVLAHDITAQAHTPYAKAMALQNYFRNNDHFSYSTDVPGGEGADAMRSFLRTGVGFCEQFAGTYAALARAVGLPTRIAVGFTTGERRGDRYVVYGRNAHAWPEVYLAGLGWLAFEPTPGRGNPASESYTGIPPQQQGRAGVIPTPTEPAPGPTNPTPPTPTAPSSTAAPAPTLAPVVEPPQPSGPSDSFPTWPILGGLLIGAVACSGPLVRRLRRARRIRHADTPARQVILAWNDTLEAWRPLKFTTSPAETPRDVANRLTARIENLPDHATIAPVARRLADLATRAAWHAQGVNEADVAEASSGASRLVHVARSHRSIGARLLGWFRFGG